MEYQKYNPEDQYLDAAFKYALYLEALDEMESLNLKDPEIETIYQHSYTRIMNLVNRLTTKHKKRDIKRVTIRIVEIAAVLLLMFYLGGTIAIAASGTVRAKVVNFLTQETSQYFEIGLIPTDIEIDVPEEWGGNYFPAYIPEGFEMISYGSGAECYAMMYTRGENDFIRIGELAIGGSTSLDSEGGTVTEITIAGHKATQIITQRHRDLAWFEGNEYFYIQTSLPLEELYDMVESVMLVVR